jgi:type IV secretory pathway VirB6-like protein
MDSNIPRESEKTMRIFLKIFLPLVLLVVAETSVAQGSVPIYNIASPNSYNVCKDIPGLVNRLVNCVTVLIDGVETGYLNYMFSYFVDVGNTALILYIIFFGYKLTLNGAKGLMSDVAIVIITASAIFYFNNAGTVNNYLQNIRDGQKYMIDAATRSMASTETISCYKSAQTQEIYTVWQRADCIIAYVFGIHRITVSTEDPTKPPQPSDYQWMADNLSESFGLMDANGTTNGFSDLNAATASNPANPSNMVKKSETVNFMAFFGMIAGLFFSSQFGLLIAVTGIAVVVLMCMAFMQAALAYLASYIAVLVLAIIAPIMIPMFLFKQTKQMFEIWAKAIIGYSLNPVILMAYMSFAVHVLDFVIDNQEFRNNGFITLSQIYKNAFKNADKSEIPVMKTMMDVMGNVETKGQQAMAKAGDIINSLSTNLQAGNGTMDSENSKEVFEQVASLQDIFTDFSGDIEKSEGGATDIIGVPAVKFKTDVKDVLDMMLGMYNGDAERLADDLQSDPAKRDMVVMSLKTQLEANNNYEQNYLQSMMIIVIILALTISFLGNVMEMGSKLAGLSSGSISGVTNLYSKTTRRFTKILGS